jgi:tetratricopeptide (TPR) repeat protein
VEVTLGKTLSATGRAKEAVEAFGRALKSNPADFQALLGLTDASHAAGNDAQAEVAAKRAIELQPGSVDGYNHLGALYFDEGRYWKAANEFRRATEATPDSYVAWSNLGGALTSACDFVGALEAYRRALVLNPVSPSASSNLGLTQLWTGHSEDAVVCLEKAVTYGPNDFRIWGNLGDAYSVADAKGQSDEAPKAYARSIELANEQLRLNPRDPDALAFIATGFARTGHAAEAGRHMQAALKIDAANPDILFDAAVVAALGGRNDVALDWIRRSLAAGFCPAIAAREKAFESLRGDPRFQDLVRGKSGRSAHS